MHFNLLRKKNASLKWTSLQSQLMKFMHKYYNFSTGGMNQTEKVNN